MWAVYKNLEINGKNQVIIVLLIGTKKKNKISEEI